jgi:hypothetical protein
MLTILNHVRTLLEWEKLLSISRVFGLELEPSFCYDIKMGLITHFAVALIVCMTLFAAPVYSITLYVSPTGNDANSGTSTSTAFATIQKASTVALSGDTVQILSGTYNQKVAPVNSGNATGGYITYMPYPGATVTLDGSNIPLSSSGYREGIINIAGKSYLIFQDLNIINSGQMGVNIVPSSAGIRSTNILISKLSIRNTREMGIRVTTSNQITIQDNVIDYVQCSSGIASWLSDQVIITRNKIVNAHISPVGEGLCGHEESLSVASTTNFEVSYNDVSMNGYPAYLGNEGIDIKESSQNGKVHHNYIHDFGPDTGGALYIDGWKAGLNGTPILSTIDVYNNYVANTASGIVVGSEEGGTVEKINVYNNVVYNTGAVGIGIPRRIPADTSVPEGMKRQINIFNNTVYKARWNGGAGIYITSSRISEIGIMNNIVHFNGYNGTITAGSADVLSNNKVTASNNLVYGSKNCANDYPNCVHIIDVSGSTLYPQIHTNFNNDPLFISITEPNLRLSAGSPAINRGATLNLLNDDYDGVSRPQGSAYDIGAYEYAANPPPPSATPSPTSIPIQTMYEGEDAQLNGNAIIEPCANCSGGQLAGWIGNGADNWIQFTQISVPADGVYPVTLYYVSSGIVERQGYISINGSNPVYVGFPLSPDWSTPISKTIFPTLKSGINTLRFGNEYEYAPSIDRIVIGEYQAPPTQDYDFDADVDHIDLNILINQTVDIFKVNLIIKSLALM